MWFRNGIKNKQPTFSFLQAPSSSFHEQFLERPWDEFSFGSGSYLKDLAVNIVGFIPLGFFFYPCLLLDFQKQTGHSAAITVASVISRQPDHRSPPGVPSNTRTSAWHDLITNTLGTASRSDGLPKRDGFRLRWPRRGFVPRIRRLAFFGESADPLVSFALHSPMDPTMAVSARGDQVLFGIIAGSAGAGDFSCSRNNHP